MKTKSKFKPKSVAVQPGRAASSTDLSSATVAKSELSSPAEPTKVSISEGQQASKKGKRLRGTQFQSQNQGKRPTQSQGSQVPSE